MSDEPERAIANPPADRPPNNAGAAKARDFADKVLMGHAERRFREGAEQLRRLQQKAQSQLADALETQRQLVEMIDRLTGQGG